MGQYRRVQWTTGSGVVRKGHFHRWGESITYDEGNNPIPFTVAIVETLDGKVIQIDPNEITFEDPLST